MSPFQMFLLNVIPQFSFVHVFCLPVIALCCYPHSSLFQMYLLGVFLQFLFVQVVALLATLPYNGQPIGDVLVSSIFISPSRPTPSPSCWNALLAAHLECFSLSQFVVALHCWLVVNGLQWVPFEMFPPPPVCCCIALFATIPDNRKLIHRQQCCQQYILWLLDCVTGPFLIMLFDKSAPLLKIDIFVWK